jgi:hypothetical protein
LLLAVQGSAAAGHWAFQPLGDPQPPAIREAGWVRTPVDQFILARLEASGLAPSPPADRRSLIRRATYDLTGLPPTAEQVEAFVRDEAPDAYPKLIDRLLASPHHGEHWGRHWLDVARYSDTKGYVYAREERFWVHAWAYRDWVINALNADMPYDRFLLLQLAADQIAGDDPKSLAAMGFLTLGRRYLGVTHDIIDDRIDVVTRGLLGLSVTCARCHDHKFDPIPTEDYYALYGVFRSCSERQVLALAASAIGTGPEATAFEQGLRERLKKLNEGLAAKRLETAARARARVTDYLLAQRELNRYPEEGFDQIIAPDDLVPATVRRWRDYLARDSTRNAPVFSAWHAFAQLPDDEFSARAAQVCRDLAHAPAGAVNPLVAEAFAVAPQTMEDVARRYGALFAKVESQWQDRRAAAMYAPGPAPDGLFDPHAERLRQVLYGADSPCEVPDEPIVNTEQFFPAGPLGELWKLQKELDRWLIEAPAAPPYATILVDRPVPTNARVFRRGNPARPGPVVPRRFLAILAGPDRQPFLKGSGRLELARAITDPANPLVSRVLVNRVWMHHFGAGLVLTPSDFGTRAGPPSHPELLDWLARRFVGDGWSLKSLHRTILLSSTYQQSSETPITGRGSRLDPENRLLWRMNVHRLSFEEIRDSLFAVAGDLDVRAGGRPVELLTKPFPRRRSVYGLVDREFFPGLFRSFDVANPDLHIPQRNETTVPQQALFFLNHPLPLERARALAHHPEVEAAPTPEARVARLFRLVYQRPPTSAQVVRALDLVRSAESALDPAAPWEQLAQALLMANEFCFID